ncbi:MAG: hypothetical protein Q9218_004394 [Villophora microphyllina]
MPTTSNTLVGWGNGTPLWLDCDPGQSRRPSIPFRIQTCVADRVTSKDAFAILLAAHHPHLKLLGVSTVHGNASISHTTANAGSILTAIGSPHVPYYAGAAEPLCREAVHAPDIHGTTGLDGTGLLPQALIAPVQDCEAIVAMRQSLMAEPAQTSWLVATGALTNVALLFASFPEVAEHIRGLTIMGGATGSGFTDAPLGHIRGEGPRCGNWTPWAEFNIYCDPEAAESIFSNPILTSKTTLIPLDVTHQVLATEDIQRKVLHGLRRSNLREDPVFAGLFAGSSSEPERENLERFGKARENLVLRNLFHDLLGFFAQTYHEVFGITEGPPLHDPVAVAVVLFDVGIEALCFDDRGGERWTVDVVTDGLHSDLEEERGQVGRTIISQAQTGSPGVRIPRGLNVGAFWEIVEECLERAEIALLKRPVRSNFREDASPWTT